MKLVVALRKELLEQWRTYRMLIVAVVFVVPGLASPLLAKLTPELLRMIPEGEQIAGLIPEPTVSDAVVQYVKNLTQFGVILALLMAMGSVAREKDKGTAAMVLVKPMPRASFLLAKFGALAVTFGVSILLAGAAAYYYTLLLFEPLDLGGWLALNGLFLVYLLVYVALTLLASTVSRSQAVAGGLAFGFLMVLGILGALPGLDKAMPGQLLTWGSGLLLGEDVARWPALGVSLGLIAGALLAAQAILSRQEI